jgi:Transcriptional regulator, AbiEi antitoxin
VGVAIHDHGLYRWTESRDDAQQHAEQGLDERTRRVVDDVTSHPDGVRWGDVKRDLGDEEARYVSRLYESGRIARPARGLYLPLSGVSGVSVPTDQPDTTDTTDSPIEGLFADNQGDQP